MSDPSVVRQRFTDLDLIEVDDAGTVHDEFKPLSPSPQNARRKVSFNITSSTSKRNPAAQERDEQVSCFVDLWKLIASVALTLLFILPFLHSWYQYKQGLVAAAHSGNVPIYPSDQLQCADDYNISFSLLHRQIGLATDYCDTPPGIGGSSSHRGEVECMCTNPLEPIAHVPRTPKYNAKWDATHARNAKWASGAAHDYQATPSNQVVLYGDSIVEHFVGTDLGDVTQEAMSVKKQFDLVFDGKAMALGLAGDRVSARVRSNVYFPPLSRC
jgi:hypothetical protein